MSEPQNAFRVRLGPAAQEAVEAIVAAEECTPQEALDQLITCQASGSHASLNLDDKTWIYTTLGEFMAEAASTTKAQQDEIAARILGVEQSLNLVRLLIASLIEDRGSEEMKEIMRDITSALDNVIRPLEKDPMKVLEEAREDMRQRTLLMEGQTVRNQEGGDGREVDELEQQEPERDR